MGVLDRYNEKKKKKEEESKSKTTSGGVAERYKLNQYYRTLDTNGVDDNYIKAFISDTNSFFSGVNDKSISYSAAKSTLGDLSTRYDTIQGWFYKNKNNLNEEAYNSFSSTFDGIKSSFDSINEFYSKWESEEEYNADAERLENYYAKWGHYADQEDFDSTSANRTFVNPTDDDFAYYDAATDNEYFVFDTDAAGNRTAKDQFGNDLILVPNDEGIIKGGERYASPVEVDDKYKVNDPLALFMSMTEAERADLVYGGNVKGAKFEALREGVVNHWEQLNKDEISMYYYILNTQGKDVAVEYLRDTAEKLNSRWGSLKAQEISNIDNGFEKFVVTGLFGIEAGLDQWGTGVAQLLNGEALPTSGVQYASSEIAKSLDGLGKYAYQATVTVGNMLPSILVSRSLGMSGLGKKIVKGAGALTMGASAGGNAYGQALKEGYSEGQARTYGTLVGASEALLEYFIGGIMDLGGIGTETLLKKVSAIDKALIRIPTKFGIKIGSEIAEEELQNYLEPAFRSIIFGADYDAPTFDEFVETAIVTALSTGFLEGGSTIAEDVAETQQYRDTGRTIMGVDGSAKYLQDIAYDVANKADPKLQASLKKQAGNVSTEVATGKNFVGKAVAAVKNANNATKIGRLYNTVNTANNLNNASANQADIAKSLQRKGFNAETANDIAAALVAEWNGQELTKAQEKLLKSAKDSKVVQDAISNIIVNEQSTMGQRSQNIRDFQSNVKTGAIARALGVSVDTAKEMLEGKSTTEEKVLPESQYEVSVDGKTIDKDGNIINVVGVESIKDGKMILKTEDGTISSDEVVYATKSDALIYEAVAKMGASPASSWAMIKGFQNSEGVSAETYASAFPLAYLYGKINYEKGVFVDGKPRLGLTVRQSATAFQMGREDAAAEVKATTQASTESTITEKNANKKIIFEGFTYSKRKANKEQKASMEAIELINKMSSLEIHVYQSYKKNGKLHAVVNGKERVAPNGYYTDGNKVYIDINAGNMGEGLMLYTLSHEIGHHIARYNAQDFKAISDFLFEHYGENVPVYELLEAQKRKLKKSYKEDGKPIPNEAKLEKEAREELVCDMLSRMLADKNAYDKLMELKQKDLKLHQKLGQAIKNALDKLAKALGIYDTLNPDFMYAASAENIGEEAFRQLQEMYIKAFIQADANSQMAEKDATDDGGVKMQTRTVNGEQVVWIENSGFTNKQLHDYSAIAEFIADHIGDYYTIIESGQNVYIGEDLPNEYTHSKYTSFLQKKKPALLNAKNRASSALGEMIEIATHRRWEPTEHTDTKDAKYGMYRYDTKFAFPIKDQNGNVTNVKAYDAELLIRNASDGKKYLYDIVNIKEDTANALDLKHKEARKGSYKATTQGDVINDNVAQDTKIVNSESAEALDMELDEKTESVAPSVMNSERTWTESDYVQEREKAAKEISKAIGVSVKKAKAYIDSVNSIAKMIAEDRVRLDYFSSPGRSSFVGNVEYGGSFDFSTLCKKRRLLTGTFTAIQKALPNTALTADEILKIRNRMKDAGLEVSCGLCYVEGSRANMGQFAKEFLKLYKQYYPDAWQPNMADVNTPDGIEWVRINHPECYEQYEYFWNHYGTLKPGDKNLFASQQKPKLYQLHTEYKGEVLEKFNDDDNVEAKNLNGGIRLQSFSDFEIVHLIDTMQIIMDMSRVGLAGQAYTKVPDFAWALGDTGLKINLSLIAKGVDENGKLIFDDVEGMPIAEAMKLRDQYSKNVGTILVAFNDEQLLAAMADDRVDFIIPFHRSQWKKSQYGAMGLPAKTKDYTYMQNEKFIKPQYHEYRGRMVQDKATNYMPNEYWDFSKSGKENAEAYLEMCARNNKRPKFYKLLQNNGDGSYSLKADGSTDGYWKLLIDFKMYDNDGNGSPQMPVKPEFNMDEAQRMMNDYQGGHSNFPVAQGIVDEFVQEYKDSHKGALYSDRDNAPTFYSQMAKVIDGVKQEKLGAASVVSMLRGKGVKAEEIKWSGIEEFLEGKKSVTKAELQEFIFGSMLQIEEEILDNKDRPYTEDQQNKLDEYEAKRDEVAKRLADEWKKITGDEFPIRNTGAGLESAVVNKIIDANKEYKDASFEGRLLSKLRKDLQQVIENNDDFGFDSWKDALRSIHRHRRDFIPHYEMSTNDKAVIVKYCNALNAYNELPNRFSDADTERLRAIARETDPWNRKIMEVKNEHNEEESKYMTNWKQYSLEGGRNYREMLFRIPGSTYTNESMMTHWKDRTGVLAHARVQDLDTFIGKMLFIEEIQSDWHNAGRKDGYREPGVEDKYTLSKKMEEYTEAFYASPTADMVREKISAVGYEGAGVSMILNFLLDSQDSMNSTLNTLSRKGASFTESEVSEIAKYAREYEEMYHKWETAPGDLTAPDAPFKDTYHEYVLKRLLRIAAEQDYDSIGWTTAETQDERWQNNMPHKEGTGKSGFLKAYTIEYDQNMRNFLDKFGKKWGTTVGKTVLDNGTEVWSMAITDSMKESVMTEGQPLYSDRDSDGNQLSVEQQEFFKDSKVRDANGNLLKVFHGTPKKFTTFRQGTAEGWGQGIYFTDNIEAAKEFGENIVEAYLNITNPFNSDTMSYYDLDFESTKAYQNFDKKNWQRWYDEYDTYEEYRDDGMGVDIDMIYTEYVDVFNQILRELGYDGIIANQSNNIDGYEIVAFHENQPKLTSNTNPTSSDDMRFQDRTEDSVSNRSLLANAFEGLAQNDIERNKIQEYKSKIELINDEERKLSELNAQIKEMSFSQGPRDTKKIRSLQFEANQAANRINTYDKQLLRLEASKPLQDVLAREKKKAYQKAEKRGKDALTAYKEKTAKTQRALLEKWQESRKKGIESREKTAMRHKIQSVVGELNQLLLSNDKKRHVPDSLKKAVADALALVNMDTVGAEERAAKYAALIAKETDPDKIDAYTVTMENILRQGEKMGQRIKELRDAYDEIQNSDDPDIANAYDPVIAENLKELAGSIGNTSLRDMSVEQLQDVYNMYKMVLTRVRDANKSFIKGRAETISNLASRVVGEVKRVGGEHKYRAAILDFVKKFGWDNMKPVYAFEHIGSSTFTDVFNSVRAGEDVWAVDVTEARKYYLDKSKKYGYDSWDFKKKYRFKSASELEFDLTLEQILSLYAYSKREQAFDHLRLGGFVFDSNIETYKENGSKLLKYKVNTADAHQITPEILANIIGNLSEEQKSFVDEMQEYLSTVMGAKGNEVTMAMYGVKLFKEKFYFPLKSAKQFMFEQNEVSGEVRIKNSGFTNKVVAKANNPVILSNFMDVWANHVNDMSMYHAFVLPLEDFNRIFNYNSPKQEGQPPVSVKGTIQNAYGPSAVGYVRQLITDLNGGARSDSTTGIINKMIGLFKKGSVFASLSVVVQQPSAIARAVALVDTKYFIGPKVDHKRHKALWDEVKQYAPVAIIKEMGYFDTNMGKSTQDFITGKEYAGFNEKMKALVADSNYRDELLSKAPALADEIAWCSIWEAVKRETQAKNPGMDVKSEAFLKMAGERFTEVIVKTQVYDSVLSRSGMMRSKDTGMKMATAFMAEPTTSINMIADALLQGKRGNRKYCRTAIGAVIASQILNSILVSFVYALRDDDEDETYLEKYIGALTGEIFYSLNPATYIPFIKDIVSIARGYDVERSDMAVISDLWKAWENLSSDKISAYRKVENFAGSIAQIFGLPLKNIMRDLRAIYQTIMS